MFVNSSVQAHVVLVVAVAAVTRIPVALEAFSAAAGAVHNWCTGTLHDLLPDGRVITGFSLRDPAHKSCASISGFQAKVKKPTLPHSQPHIRATLPIAFHRSSSEHKIRNTVAIRGI